MNDCEPSGRLGRWALAALVAGAAYILAYTQNFSPLDYYPMVGEWHRGEQDPALGPRITYYGWKLVGLAAGLATLLLPARLTARLPVAAAWLGGVVLCGIVLAHESHWFLKG